MDNREGDREAGTAGGARPPRSGTRGTGGGHRYWYAGPPRPTGPDDEPEAPDTDLYQPGQPGAGAPGHRDPARRGDHRADPGWAAPTTRLGTSSARHASPPPPGFDPLSDALSFDDLPTAVHPQTLPRRGVTPRFVEAPPLPERTTGQHQAARYAADDPYPQSRPSTGHLRDYADPPRDPSARGAHTAETPRVAGGRPVEPRWRQADEPHPDDAWLRPGPPDDSWPHGRLDESWPRGGRPDDGWPRAGAGDSWPRGGSDEGWPRTDAEEYWPRRGSEIGPLAIDAGRRDERALPPGRTGTDLAPRPTRVTRALPGAEPDVDDDDRDYPAVMWWTAIWYALPSLVYTLWTLTLSSNRPTGCTGPTPGCASPHSAAVDVATHHIVGILVAAVLSFGVAWCIRRATLAWRAISVGFAAAVVGAGLATMVATIIG